MIVVTWSLPLLRLVVSFTLVLTSNHVVNAAPATTEAVVVEISDGQIQNPPPTRPGTSLFKATDIAGHEIFYMGSVGQNTLGFPITDLFGTVQPVTTTNSVGSIVTGLLEPSSTQGSMANIMPVSAIPTLLSLPPSFAFTTVDANNRSVVNLGQVFTRANGSTSTAVILSGVSTSRLTTVNSQGSTVLETLGLFTQSNGSVVTSTLSFVTDSSSLALSIAIAGRSSRTASTTTSYRNLVTGVSGTNTGPRAASINGTARSSTASVKTAMSADSSSTNSSSLRNPPNAPFLTSNQTIPSRSIDTVSAAMVSVTSATLTPSLQPSGTYVAFPTSIIQPTSRTGQPPARTTSAGPIARSGLSWSHVAGGSASAVGLLTSRGTTTAAGKSGMPLEGQASLSASITTRSNSTDSTAGGMFLLAVQSDAALAESLTMALLGQQVPTITTVPPGMVIQSMTTRTKCSHAFAMATTTSSGSTVTTVVPKICHDDAAFLLFGGAAIPLLCTKALSLLGFLLRYICDPKTGVLVGVDDITGSIPDPPAGGGSAEGSTSDPEDNPQSEDDKPTNSQDSSVRASSTAFLSSTSSPSTSRPSSTMTTSASSAAATPYYLFGGVGDEDEVSDHLGALNSKYKALQPAVGSTPMSGADWVNINLTANDVASLSSDPDVLLLAPYISLPEPSSVTGNEVSTSASFSTLSTYPLTTLYSLSDSSASSETSFPSGFSKAKVRRDSPSHRTRENGLSSRELNVSERVVLSKRDTGRNILKQYGLDNKPCPRDLAVISWAPGVPAVLDYPYIFLQSQGENTWAILVSSGIESGHVDFKGNWGPDSSQTNIDPNPLDVPGMYPGGNYDGVTGTCYAAKIGGRVSGVAKQATIIPMRTHGFGPQWLIAVLHRILGEIPRRREQSPPQCLPGKIVVVITFDYDLTDKQYELSFEQQDYAKSMMRNAIKAIQDLGVIVITLAGDELADITNPFVSNNVPQTLASEIPLIRVGSVDQTGKMTLQTKKGDVYMVGQSFLCAAPSFLPAPLMPQNKYIDNGNGTAGAAAAFTGLVLYDLGRSDPPFELGDDITQYQAKAFAYYTTEGKGSYIRLGGNALVGWNGLDNSDPDQCPAAYRKRDGADGGACEVPPSTSIPANSVTASSLEVATATNTNGNLLGAAELVASAIAAGEAAGEIASATRAAGLTRQPYSTSTATMPISSPLACTQVFYYPKDGADSFLCQCSDSTWNHFRNVDFYSQCPSQVSVVSLTTATPSATVPPGFSCSLVVFGPSTVNYGNFCECNNSMFWGGGCPTSIHVAATTTFTFSRPPATVTAGLTNGDYVTPSPSLSPSMVTPACVPQCTKLTKPPGPHGEMYEPTCFCNPACGGNAHPKPDGNNVCPDQVAVIA